VTTRGVGAIALVVTGVWAVVIALRNLSTAFLAFQDGSSELGAIALGVSGIIAVFGFFLVLLARRIAGLLLPDDPIEDGPTLEEALPIALAFAGAWLLVENAFYLLRLLLPFLFYGQWQRIAWSDLAYDALTVTLAALLFVRSRAIARLWLRVNRPRERAAP
jgi:hypothetical protein